MKRLILFFLASIGAITLTLLVLVVWEGKRLLDQGEESPPMKITPSTVLTLHLGNKPFAESQNVSFLPIKSQETLRSTILRLERASVDKRIKGLILILEGSEIGLAQTQELRHSIQEFRKSGKFVYAFATTFGELTNGTIAYYLASAADQIWLQPMGFIGLTGLNIEIPFGKDALDALKLSPHIEHREQYKSFTESLTENDFTPAYRENVNDLLKNLTSQLVNDTATARNIQVDDLEKLINKGPWLGKEGITHKLIDGIGYLSELKTKIQTELGGEPTYMTLTTYAKKSKKRKPDAKMAIVYIDGIIEHGRSYEDDANGEWEASDETVIRGLRQAAKDVEAKAIILRIDSGGGSAIASETIWHEVKEIVAQGKPVIVSMGDMAASGGYYIATAANKIVANPATLTGSIGVFGGKIQTSGLWDQLGIHWRVVNQNENASMWSWQQGYTEYGRKRLQAWIDEVYETFQQRVMDGRKLDKARVHELAKGRVWTGAQALEKGLVDNLGGLLKALEVAKKEVGMDPAARIKLEEFPRPHTFMQKVFSLLSGGPSSYIHGFVRGFQDWVMTLVAPRQVLETASVRVQG